MTEELVLEPFSVKSAKRSTLKDNISHPWISGAVAAVAAASVFGLIVLILLLVIPIIVLAIGVHYRDPRYCPIEPRISLFLIVNGSVSLALITVTILISVLTIFLAFQRSFILIILGIILFTIIFISGIFSFIWFIIGSVWTFRVHQQVTHEYDTIDHIYPYNYCHPVLYRFTFIYLIIAYVLLAIQCCYRCFTNIRGSKSRK